MCGRRGCAGLCDLPDECEDVLQTTECSRVARAEERVATLHEDEREQRECGRTACVVVGVERGTHLTARECGRSHGGAVCAEEVCAVRLPQCSTECIYAPCARVPVLRLFSRSNEARHEEHEQWRDGSAVGHVVHAPDNIEGDGTTHAAAATVAAV